MKRNWKNRLKRKFGGYTTCAYCEEDLQSSGILDEIIKFIEKELKNNEESRQNK